MAQRDEKWTFTYLCSLAQRDENLNFTYRCSMAQRDESLTLLTAVQWDSGMKS